MPYLHPMTEGQYEIVYDFISLALACMMATTLFLWLRMAAMPEQQRPALAISGLVTFIASYHYYRIFNSWTEAYTHQLVLPGNYTGGSVKVADPVLTGKPFNDGYRYMDWLITVPLLLIEVVLVMNMPVRQTAIQATKLGLASALMIILGFPGEVAFDGDSVQKRWIFWGLAMLPFIYIVYVMGVDLRKAVMQQKDKTIRQLTLAAQWGTIVSWTVYPVVYILPMLYGSSQLTSEAVVAVQIGYSVADVVSKCGVGLLIYFVTSAKATQLQKEREGLLSGKSDV